jgi:hypothetical protein
MHRVISILFGTGVYHCKAECRVQDLGPCAQGQFHSYGSNFR